MTSTTHRGIIDDKFSKNHTAEKLLSQPKRAIHDGNERSENPKHARRPFHVFKVRVVGAAGVGKSELINRVSRTSPVLSLN